MALLINFLAFQVGWFSSVIGAAKQMPWLGPVVLVFVLAIHLRQARRPHLEVGLLVICGTIGLFFESLLVVFGWVSYPSGQFSAFLAPYWIVTMWLLFGTTLNVSIGGPASYIAGQKLGGIIFLDYTAALLALAIGWAVAMPLLLSLSTKLDGISDELVTQEISE